MKAKLVGGAVTCLLAAGCGETDAQKQIRATAKDPESLQFGETTASGALECGTVNGKNSFGGYVGFRPYISYNGQVAIAENDQQAAVIPACCTFIRPLKGTGVAPWDAPHFSTHCVGLPGGIDFTKPF